MTALAAAQAPSLNAITIEPLRPVITTVTDVAIGINIGASTQALWDDYDISNTSDSGIIMGEIAGDPVTTVRRVKMRDIGKRVTGHPAYAVHGIYCRRPNTVIEDVDVEMSPDFGSNTDGFTLRYYGISLNRFRSISNTVFAMTYFEYGTTPGTVTIKNGTGFAPAPGGGGTGIWVDVGLQSPVRQTFVFENVHFTVTGASPKFAKAAVGSYAGGGITLRGCTLNGAKVTASDVTVITPVTIL